MTLPPGSRYSIKMYDELWQYFFNWMWPKHSVFRYSCTIQIRTIVDYLISLAMHGIQHCDKKCDRSVIVSYNMQFGIFGWIYIFNRLYFHDFLCLFCHKIEIDLFHYLRLGDVVELKILLCLLLIIELSVGQIVTVLPIFFIDKANFPS